jgi:hypothetical protein
MELTFEKIGDWYISEFGITSDFNLHIEKEPKGDFYLYQRTSSSGQYDIIQDFGYKKGGDNVIDLDFQALVYPKWIKIKSAVKPLIATITTDGEVNEVIYQAKDIEITSNGTTKVTADTGYTALGSVNVKVNVPQSGGGEGSSIEYLDVSSEEHRALVEIALGAAIVKLKDDSRTIIAPPMMILMSGNELSTEKLMQVTAFAIDLDIPLKGGMFGNGSTIRQLYGAYLENAPRITKEEFYNLNA